MISDEPQGLLILIGHVVYLALRWMKKNRIYFKVDLSSKKAKIKLKIALKD